MKRWICALLTLIMLLGVMPVAASAAGMAVSENAITVLKNLQDYSDECEKVGNEYRTGYGTVCEICTKAKAETAHTHSEKQADADLRDKLKELNSAVNSFASSAGVTLSQNKFDALVLITYDIGTAWLSGSGVLRSAVVNGLTGNSFLNSIGQSSGLGGDPTDQITGQRRRMVEANMYLNGAYSDTPPSNYGWVNYDVNGGVMAEGSNGRYTQYFDCSTVATPAPVPTRKGYTFLGWYMNGSNYISWVSGLAHFQVKDFGATLTAQWQPDGTTYGNAMAVYDDLNPKTLASKDIYDVPNGKSIGTHEYHSVRIDRDWIDSKGNRWGHLKAGSNGTGTKDGWVLVSGNTPTNTKFDIDVTVTVTTGTLNGRRNPNAASTQLETFHSGDKLRIVATATTAYKLWGQVADEEGNLICWVCLMYTNWNEVKDQTPGDANNSENTEAIAEAVVNCNGYLNVRSAAGTDNAIVGALADGDHVEIYEIEFVNGHQWGRTTGGWILLTYAKVTMVEGNKASFANTKDVLAYTFTGTLKQSLKAHVDVRHNSEEVGDTLKAGSVVAVSLIKNGPADQQPADEGVWGFNGIGWIHMSNIDMEVAKYVVISDGITVRDNPANSAAQIEKVSKGVELNITNLAVVDATIWGYTDKYEGWVNLASKFVKRSNAPVIENVTGNTEYNYVATVVNTDNVNIRKTSSASSGKMGTLPRGAVVRVWESAKKETWYKVDTNQNGVRDENNDGWVSAAYLSLDWSPVGEESEEEGSSAASTVIETGMGVVANTYAGVNIRQGAGTGYASTGKYLNGTAIEILEVTSTATSKWGKTKDGWVCMDYVNMLSKYAIGGSTEETSKPAGPNAGGSTTTEEGNVSISSTPVSYTGYIDAESVELKKTADEDAIVTDILTKGTNVTVQELRKVVTKATAEGGSTVDGNVTTESVTITTSTTYWARINGGWIELPPAGYSAIKLNPLEEIVYTNVGESDVNVRSDANGALVTTMPKGTQVTITSVKIYEDKVWGFAEDIGTTGGWIRLDMLSEGAHTVQEETKTETNTNTNTQGGTNVGGLNMGAGGNNAGGQVPTGGYRYTGKIINTNQVNVRAFPNSNNGTTVTTTLKAGASLVIYETTINQTDLSAWGRCDAGWVHLYYVDLVPATNDGAVDARVVQSINAPYYSDNTAATALGTYAKGNVVDIYEIVGTMARTTLGWVSLTDLLN